MELQGLSRYAQAVTQGFVIRLYLPVWAARLCNSILGAYIHGIERAFPRPNSPSWYGLKATRPGRFDLGLSCVQTVHVLVWYVLGLPRGYHIVTLRTMYFV